MLRRRQINLGESAPRLRSTLATAAGPVREAAWAVEERLVWRGADALRRAFRAAAPTLDRASDAVKWSFERLAWPVEQKIVWPIQERTGEWSAPLRVAGAAAVAFVAIGVGAASLLLVASGGNHETIGRLVAAKVVAQPQPQPASPAAPTLQGAPPLFAPPGGVKAPRPAEAEAARGGAAPQAGGASAKPSPAPVEVAGPAAIAVARRFSDAFVLFETGQADAEVRAALHATATPLLARRLLKRPPRLPAGVTVPMAEVLNLVPGPRYGDTYTISASLLRVGVTSELRLGLQRDPKSGAWLVTEVLG